MNFEEKLEEEVQKDKMLEELSLLYIKVYENEEDQEQIQYEINKLKEKLRDI